MATPPPDPGPMMTVDAGERMFASLPGVYRSRDTTGDLARLLGVLEELFFTGSSSDDVQLPGSRATDGDAVPTESRSDEIRLPGLERQIQLIPNLFLPLDTSEGESRTPPQFLPWLASYLSFTPHTLFPPEMLRQIIAKIVPLYGRRGTRRYLEQLLELCFGNELAQCRIDDRPRTGFTIGESRLGVDTWLAEDRPFWFIVTVERRNASGSSAEPSGRPSLEHRLRVVIDFAKPAHTDYELRWEATSRDTHEGDAPPVSREGHG